MHNMMAGELERKETLWLSLKDQYWLGLNYVFIKKSVNMMSIRRKANKVHYSDDLSDNFSFACRRVDQ